MTLKEFKVWGRKREEKDSLYIWAKDADDAIGIARLTDQSVCISQWTGNEKSYEEAIKLVKEVTGMSLDWDDAHYEALQMAIKALEKEPCEDAISRQSMLDYLKYLHGEMSEEEFVKALPSVIPTRPAGHWIDHSDEGFVECSECGSATNCDGNIADLHFCFNCGAKMDEDGRTLKYSDQDTMMQAT